MLPFGYSASFSVPFNLPGTNDMWGQLSVGDESCFNAPQDPFEGSNRIGAVTLIFDAAAP